MFLIFQVFFGSNIDLIKKKESIINEKTPANAGAWKKI